MLTTDDYRQFPAVPADQRLRYGPEPDQFGDLYLPPAPGPHPTVVLLHGGCWRAAYDLTPLGRLCDALRREGLAVWSLAYRRLGTGGGWPTTFDDVAAGTDFLRTLAEHIDLDLSRVITVGHSAGGHLALWLAGRHRLPPQSRLFRANPLPVTGVVALAGIPDLAAGIRWRICGDACQALMGASPDEAPERYRQASPVDLLPFGVPQRHIVGAHDEIVPVAYLEAHVALAKQHDSVTLEVLPSAGHFELVDPRTVAWSTVQRTVLTLLGTI